MDNKADDQKRDGGMPNTATEYVIFEGTGMDEKAQSTEWGSALIITTFM